MISPLSAHITIRGIKRQVTRELSSCCAPRFRVAVIGDSWIVTAATGKQIVCASIEDTALVVAEAAKVAGVLSAASQVFVRVDAAPIDSSISGFRGDSSAQPDGSRSDYFSRRSPTAAGAKPQCRSVKGLKRDFRGV